MAPRVADPVVGGSGEIREDVGQEAQQGAPALKAPLCPMSRRLLPGHRGRIGQHAFLPPGPSGSFRSLRSLPMPLHIKYCCPSTPAWGPYFWGPRDPLLRSPSASAPPQDLPTLCAPTGDTKTFPHESLLRQPPTVTVFQRPPSPSGLSSALSHPHAHNHPCDSPSAPSFLDKSPEEWGKGNWVSVRQQEFWNPLTQQAFKEMTTHTHTHIEVALPAKGQLRVRW